MNPTRSNHFRPRSISILFSMVSVILLAATGLFVFSQPGPAKASNTLTLIPIADSYVNQSQPTTNYGANQSLRTDGSPIVNSYLRFNVSGIGTSQVSKITLRIYANSSSNGGVSVRKVADNNWQETQINYQNAPTLGVQVGKSSRISGGTWFEVDITSLVNADGTISLALVGNDSQAINLAAKENTNHQPQLLIETSSVSTPTYTRTPTKIPTATATQSNTAQPTPPSGGDYQPGFPIRAAFFYPWFPESWNQAGYNPFTNYTPSLGLYDSGSTSVIQNQIQAMTYGNINAAILSWWGQGTKSDQRVSIILGATPGSSNPNFRWSIYYENESQGNPAISQIESDLSYFQSHYGANASFLRVNGKFVVFVYADATDACGMADRWVQADNALGHPAYIVLKVFSGYRTCASQPDSWHQYSPAVATDEQKGFSYAISAGFWKMGETSPRLARNLTTWTTDVKSMVASSDPWQLVTTFNEWGEGTSIESAQEWASSSGYGQYMDVLHTNGSTGIQSQPTATKQPTNPPATATSTLHPTNPPATATPTGNPTQKPPTATATRQASPTSTATPRPSSTPDPTRAPTNTPVPATPTLPAPTATQSSGLTPVNLTKGPDLLYSGSNTEMKLFWQWTTSTTFRVDWGTSTTYGSSSPATSAYDATNHLYAYTITESDPWDQILLSGGGGQPVLGGQLLDRAGCQCHCGQFHQLWR